MERQTILAELYPGLAVVKAEIILGNRSENNIAISLGLPKSGSFSHDEISIIKLDSLFDLKISWKGRDLTVKTITTDLRSSDIYLSLPESYRDSVSQWYGWMVDIPPGSRDTLRLSYAVRTGPAQLARGGNVRRSFFLGFLLEQARAWEGQMQDTELQIDLKGRLLPSQVFGIYPREVFEYDDRGRLYFQISGRNPLRHDDVLMGYDSKDGFDYLADYLQNKDKYAGPMKRIPPDSLKTSKMPSGRFDVYPSREYAVLGALAACLGLAALLVIYLIKRR
ncbi:MAG: hypothetical protein RDU76_09315 [Candidatus Edwardsbacteria bacterium]|nr:hypothetical protein [Candidatus Edwardsbacteria bacterium]